MIHITKFIDSLQSFCKSLQDGVAKTILTPIADGLSSEIVKLELEKLVAETEFYKAEADRARSETELNQIEAVRLAQPHYKEAMDRRLYLDKQVMGLQVEFSNLKVEVEGMHKEKLRLFKEVKALAREKEAAKWNKANIGPKTVINTYQKNDPQRTTIGDAVQAKKEEVHTTA